MSYERRLWLVCSFLLIVGLTACSSPTSLPSSNRQGIEIDEVQHIKELELEEEGFFEYVDSRNSTRSFRGKMTVRLHLGYVVVEKKSRTFVIPQERIVFIGEKQPDFYGN